MSASSTDRIENPQLPELLPIRASSNQPQHGVSRSSYQKVPIYSGSVSLWIGWQGLLGMGLTMLAGMLLLAGSLWEPEPELQRFMALAGAGASALGLLTVALIVIGLRSLRYTIDERLIEREKGILFKRVDSLDLSRVQDLELRQSLLQRLFGLGSIYVYSSDRTDPVMTIAGLPGTRSIYNQLREVVLAIAQQRGIVHLDR